MIAAAPIASTAVLNGLQAFGLLLKTELSKVQERETTLRTNHLASLQAEVAQERIRAQKDILELMIQTARHVFDRKMDFVSSSFDQLMAMLREHQQSLLQRQEELTRQLLTASAKQEKLLIVAELAKVRDTLLEIDHRATQAQKDVSALVYALSLSLGETLPAAALMRG